MQNQFSAQLDASEFILGFAYFGLVTDVGRVGLMASFPFAGSPPRASAPCFGPRVLVLSPRERCAHHTPTC